jgi:hypothetical protein
MLKRAWKDQSWSSQNQVLEVKAAQSDSGYLREAPGMILQNSDRNMPVSKLAKKGGRDT